MDRTVTLPLWLFVVILLAAAITAATHLLFPSVRWFLRRRAEGVVARLNERLARPIQPFKLLTRQDTIQRVVYDPEVVRAATDFAEETGVREDVAMERARRYAREIVPAFSATAYFALGTRVSRWLAKGVFDVRIAYDDADEIAAIDPRATVVYVMNHRSNFDYLLVTYLVAPTSALSYAVGEWARVWPLSALIRTMGAYFIRRRTPDALYRRVLASYVAKATAGGVTQAVFPEGGLSRDGAVGEPKLGILSYITDGWRADGRPVVFVPVALNYDRVVEDRVLVAAGRSEKRRFRASAPEAALFIARYLWRRATGQVGRFGVAAVTFARPVALSDYVEAGAVDVPGLAGEIMGRIRAAVPAPFNALLLTALDRAGGEAAIDDLRRAVETMHARRDTPVAHDGATFAGMPDFRAALDVLSLRRIISVEGETVRIEDADLVAFYRASLDGLNFSE